MRQGTIVPYMERSRRAMAKTMRQGTLVPDYSTGRMDIRFSPEEYYGWLHCGETMEILMNGKWEPTCIEMSFEREWYLVGVKCDDFIGLTVRTWQCGQMQANNHEADSISDQIYRLHAGQL